MSLDRAPSGDDRQNAEETSGLVPGSTLNLISCLLEKSKALLFAAHETRKETEPLPRNLLAAYTRIERHVEIFLKVTNSSLVHLNASDKFLADILIHRRECAIKMVAIGRALECPGGFLPPEVHGFSEEQCRSCLTAAAGLTEELGKSFRTLAETYSVTQVD